MTRPDHVVLAGHTGRLLARVGLTAHTQWETDQHVIGTAVDASRELGRPITGPELHDLWEAAHTLWFQQHPPPATHLAELLDRIGQILADQDRADAVAQAQDRHATAVALTEGDAVLRHVTLTAPGHVRDRLPAWMTDPVDDLAVIP